WFHHHRSLPPVSTPPATIESPFTGHNHHRAPLHRPHRLPPHLPSPTTVLTFLHVERRAARGSSGNTRIKPSNKVSPSSDKGMMSGNGEFIALGLALRR
ncbi:hypothetical protein Drorol1_Dr00012220, partial [Drosera rotundifolia]